MIVFNKIKEYDSIENIDKVSENDFLFFGKAIDDRGNKINSFLNSKYKNSMQIEYKNEIDSFLLYPYTEITQTIKRLEIKTTLENILDSGINRIVFESTTLGYCELLLILYTINMLNIEIKIKIYYAEPEKYTSKDDNEEYELSEEYSNHKYIKPFVLPTPHDSTSDEQATLITLVGFEESRMGRVLNDSENKYNQKISIFPIPGFKFGWENISLSKHHIFLNEKENIYYTPADDPYETYKVLNKIIINLPERRIVIMPIGTKPCTIGTAIFLINAKEENKFSRIATKYDFPTKKNGRSIGIDKVYEYWLETKYK
jgi:hypothetical protein